MWHSHTQCCPNKLQQGSKAPATRHYQVAVAVRLLRLVVTTFGLINALIAVKCVLHAIIIIRGCTTPCSPSLPSLPALPSLVSKAAPIPFHTEGTLGCFNFNCRQVCYLFSSLCSSLFLQSAAFSFSNSPFYLPSFLLNYIFLLFLFRQKNCFSFFYLFFCFFFYYVYITNTTSTFILQ